MLEIVMVALDTLPDVLLAEIAAAVVRTVVEHRLGDFEALVRERVAAP